VVIATPTPLHPQMIKQAAWAGKHVFCEKPLGLDLAASAEAVAVAEERGILLQVGFVRRFQPAWQDARQRIRAGAIGEVYLFRAGQREKIAYEDTSYIEQVGNFFQDVMVHEFDLALWMVGPIDEVNAWGANQTNSSLDEIGDTQTACVQVRFANGALGTLDGTMLSSHGYDCYTEILGQRGAIRVGFDARATDTVEIAAGAASLRFPTDFRKRFREGFVGEIHAFADSILTGAPVAVGGRDGLEASALAEAATESLRCAAPVRVSHEDLTRTSDES